MDVYIMIYIVRVDLEREYLLLSSHYSLGFIVVRSTLLNNEETCITLGV